MASIRIALSNSSNIKIMIFTEGTILKPKSFFSLYNHKSYLPIGDSVSLINKWNQQGAEIVYCTSRRGQQAIEIAELLKQYHFAGTELYYRGKGETYKDLVEKVIPDILIEDNCRSIGGSRQMCITKVGSEIKAKIVSIVVKEFKGIDDLPETISGLCRTVQNRNERPVSACLL